MDVTMLLETWNNFKKELKDIEKHKKNGLLSEWEYRIVALERIIERHSRYCDIFCDHDNGYCALSVSSSAAHE